MKTRMGFVSNSSSSSFCIIGSSTDRVINKLLKAHEIKLDSDDYEESVCGVKDVGDLQFIGAEGSCYHVGMDAEKLLETMTIPQACEYVRKAIKDKYEVDGSFKFIYGEISTG